jgi:hypothetical protein
LLRPSPAGSPPVTAVKTWATVRHRVRLGGEATAEAMAELRRQRRRISGKLPYGYDLGDDGKTLVSNPVEQRVARNIRTWLGASPPWSLRKVAGELNRRGIPAKGGGVWYASTVRSVMARWEKLTADMLRQ